MSSQLTSNQQNLIVKLAMYLVTIAGFLSAGSMFLPDTAAGSPRSIAVALAGVLSALSILLQAIARFGLLPPPPVTQNASGTTLSPS